TCTDVTYLKSAKAALEESEESFRAIFEQASVGVARVALDGTYLQVNNRFCEITGYSHDELRGLNVRDLMYPEDLTSSLEQVGKLISGQIQRYALKSRQVRKDTSVSWIYVSPTVVRHTSGQPHYMIWVIEDINDLERMRLQLQEQKQRLDAALMASETGTFRWDFRTGEFQSDNNLDRLFGLRPSESVRNWDQFASRIVAEDRDRSVACHNRCAAEGGDFENVFRVVWPDGTVHWLRDRGKTFPDEHGQPAYITGACVEITEQMETQQQFQSSQQLLLLAQAAAGIGTWEWDLTTGRMKLSPEVYRMFGIPEQEVPAAMEERFNLIHPEDRPKVHDVWEKLSKGQQDKGEVEFRIGWGSGSRWVSWKGRAIRDPAGRVIRIVGAGVDVSERRRSEDEKRRAEKLDAAGRLATSIAHEINNPLEALVNVLHLIRNSSSLEEAHKYSRI